MGEIERLNELVQPLVGRVVSGDRDALERIVQACRGVVYRWVLSKTADTDDADELTQIVMIRVGDTVAGYRGESLFTTWLYRVVANAVADFYRNNKRREISKARYEQQQNDTSYRAEQVTDMGLEKLHNAHVAQLIAFFFRKLPPQQREIFDLVDLQGFTPTEVSRMTGKNASTVRAHLLKARRAIRRRIITQVPELAEEIAE